MKKIFKWIMIAIPVLLIAGLAFIVGGSYFEHRQLVEQEKAKYPPPGLLVDINNDGNSLHVFTEGEGSQTLVFMSGLGTSSPVYDFKVLYNNLSKDYRVAVVERAGYGWSEITESPRDIDTVLEETRSALQLAGESPPYVLFPHSMAGLEALYWANLYPDEVKTIIGLDPLVPGYYEQTEEEPSFLFVINLLARTGLIRNQPGVFRDNFPAMQKGHLTEEEAEAAEAIFFRRLQTDNMWEEAEMVPQNSGKVSAQGKPDLKFHAFISVENEEEAWKDSITAYTKATGGDYYLLDAGHYIHLYKPELIADKSRELIKKASGN